MATTRADGALSWKMGVDSNAPTTVQSPTNPDGIARNAICWLTNATVRDGGITQRAGWKYVSTTHDGSVLFQGGEIYTPIDGSNPYIIVSLSGHIWKVNTDGTAAVDLSAQFHLFNPPAVDQAYFVQGEEFMIIQAGDLVTLPLFWDGVTLRRSFGLGGAPVVAWQVTITNTNDPRTGHVFPAGSTFTVQGDGAFTTSAPFILPAAGGNVTVNITTGGSLAGTINVTSNPGNPFSHPSVPPTISQWQTTAATGVTSSGDGVTPELPAATAMDYYMGRIWYAQGRQYCAGDIVQGPSGTLAYDFRDSILKVTENPIAVGGDGFVVPENAGNIRALKHSANLDRALGQSQLFIGTRKAWYQLDVPVSRNDWIAATNSNQPRQMVAQQYNGPVGDRCCVAVNGDLYYQSLEPDIRSLITATRFFNQPGNKAISSNVNRILQFNDRALMRFSTGIAFDNRLLQSALPVQRAQGVVFQSLIPLDFVPMSSFAADTSPIWEGNLEGLDILQMWVGDYGGRNRAFAFIVSRVDSSIQLFEFTQRDIYDTNVIGEERVTWVIEFPAFTWGNEFLLKKLVSAEEWVDRIFGEVIFKMEYRQDGSSCWNLWHEWKVCSARNTTETVNDYPAVPLGPGFKQTMTLPVPQDKCESATHRPANVGYQMQTRLTIKGFCRIRGHLLHAEEVVRVLWEGKIC